MEKLLEQIENYLDIELSNEQEVKIKGNFPVSGRKVEIYWEDKEEFDSGYLFRLPNQDEDEDMLDVCVHIMHINNYCGADKEPEEWVHLKTLLTFDKLSKVKVL